MKHPYWMTYWCIQIKDAEFPLWAFKSKEYAEWWLEHNRNMLNDGLGKDYEWVVKRRRLTVYHKYIVRSDNA